MWRRSRIRIRLWTMLRESTPNIYWVGIKYAHQKPNWAHLPKQSISTCWPILSIKYSNSSWTHPQPPQQTPANKVVKRRPSGNGVLSCIRYQQQRWTCANKVKCRKRSIMCGCCCMSVPNMIGLWGQGYISLCRLLTIISNYPPPVCIISCLCWQLPRRKYCNYSSITESLMHCR